MVYIFFLFFILAFIQGAIYRWHGPTVAIGKYRIITWWIHSVWGIFWVVTTLLISGNINFQQWFFEALLFFVCLMGIVWGAQTAGRGGTVLDELRNIQAALSKLENAYHKIIVWKS